MNTTYLNLDLQQYTVKSLRELEIKQMLNEHSSMHITALLYDEQKDNDIYDTKAGTQIALEQKNGEQNELLFQGIVTKIAIEKKQDIYYLNIEALSNTYLLDIKKVSQSFQNVNMTYIDMIKKVLQPYQGSDVIDNASEGKTIENLIVQYMETDWEFIKRVVSHFHAGVVPFHLTDKPKFTIGIPKGENIGDLQQYHYSIEKDIERYLKSSQNDNENLKELDTVLFHIQTNQNFNIGDSATFQNISLYIKQKTMKMQNGVMIYDYILSSENSFTQDSICNENIAGISLKGKVLEVIGDMVKVQLEIDAEQTKKEEAYPFQYTTMYTAEGNTGWYCMPEIDDTVMIYFPTEQEKYAVGVNSIRVQNKGSDKIGDTDVKYFRTKNGKELKFSPEEILITCCNGTDEKTGEKHITYIRLHDNNGIEMMSTEPIFLKSDDNIALQAKEQIFFAAKEEIVFKCKTSQITINDMVDIAGKEIRMN